MPGEDQGPIDGLDRLYADRTPEPALEARVWQQWEGSGGRSAARQRRGSRVWFQVAAGLVLFVAGWATHGIASEAPTPSEEAAAYMLMLWQPPQLGDEAPEEVARQYAGWAREVATSGVGVRGDELSDVDRALVGEPDRGPGGFVSGYFVVDANDLAEASDLARSHPHLERGGWIEVSRVVRR